MTHVEVLREGVMWQWKRSCNNLYFRLSSSLGASPGFFLTLLVSCKTLPACKIQSQEQKSENAATEVKILQE